MLHIATLTSDSLSPVTIKSAKGSSNCLNVLYSPKNSANLDKKKCKLPRPNLKIKDEDFGSVMKVTKSSSINKNTVTLKPIDVINLHKGSMSPSGINEKSPRKNKRIIFRET